MKDNATLILLAAGRGTRMGTSKGLLSFNGSVWIEHQIKEFFHSGGSQVICVFGESIKEYLGALNWEEHTEKQWFDCCRGSVLYVKNHDVEKGPYGSIVLALPHVRTSHALILPVDVPWAGTQVFHYLMNCGTYPVVIPSFNERGGHPVLLRSELFPILMDAKEDENFRLDRQIAMLPDSSVFRVAVTEPKTGLNINTIEDWNSFSGLMKNKETE
jgi:CTP:molybdopterin cytidylyltransferase MocA